MTDYDLTPMLQRSVLRKTGSVSIRTGIRERIASYPYVPFFESSIPLLEETLPASADVCETFAAAGLDLVAWKMIVQTIASDWTVYSEKLAAGGDSALARLSREDFDAGLAAVRRHAASPDGRRRVVEPIDLFVFRSS